jgi:hypothetical protein
MGCIHEEDAYDTGGITAPKRTPDEKQRLLEREAAWNAIEEALFYRQAFRFRGGAIVLERIYNFHNIYVLGNREFVEMFFEDRQKFWFARPRGVDPRTPWDEVSEQEYKPATGREYMGYRPYLDRGVIDALIDAKLAEE